MKTQRRSPRLALRLSAMEATRWCRLGFQVEDDSQDQRGAEHISQIDDAGELTGFFPRIDRIFPSSTSKRYSKG